MREVRHRFQIGRAFESPLARLLPIGNGLRREPRLGVVVRQQFGLGRGGLGELGLQDLRNARVILLPRAAQQRLIGGILHQGMLKEVGRLGEDAALVEQLGLDQLCQTRAAAWARPSAPRHAGAHTQTPAPGPRQAVPRL